jgi:hypothetical protein
MILIPPSFPSSTFLETTHYLSLAFSAGTLSRFQILNGILPGFGTLVKTTAWTEPPLILSNFRSRCDEL